MEEKRTSADLPATDVTDDDLHESAEVARGAVLNFKDDGGVSVVTDGHAFAEIVCECHLGDF